MAAACATTSRGEKTDREQLRAQSLGRPLQGQLSDGTIRYCVKDDESSDGLTQTDLHLQLTSALLVKKCGDQVYVKSDQTWRMHSDSSTQASGVVRGMLPAYEHIGEWECATVDPKQVNVHCTNPQPTEEPPQKTKTASPPGKSGDADDRPHKLVYPGKKTPNDLDDVSSSPDEEVDTTKEKQIRLHCQRDEATLLQKHFSERDQIIKQYVASVAEASRAKVGAALDWEINSAVTTRDWQLTEAETRYKWALQELRTRCSWKLQSGE